MTLTKEQIVNFIYNNFDLPKARSIQIVESLLEILKKRLEESEDILISGFGKFCVKDKSERRGRNPTTGEDLMLGSRRVVVFKCSGVLKDKLKGKSD
jgi:integration host factor subunit alpha